MRAKNRDSIAKKMIKKIYPGVRWSADHKQDPDKNRRPTAEDICMEELYDEN